ncbi:MAG: PAS domain-containing sensor histidine kinase [Anaerolineae bacterium]|nr:PAS domain-containing sensor histidine kinase [Anaerolineae bacterium]
MSRKIYRTDSPLPRPPSLDETTRAFQERLRVLNAVTIELTKSPTFDQLCYQAVEVGIHRLGFDRMGLGFFEESSDYFEGSFGTDEQGNVRDERGTRTPVAEVPLMRVAIRDQASIVHDLDIDLFNHKGQSVGRGWCAMAMLWDGDRAIGWVSVDNLLSQRPLTPYDLDILNLYATSLAHLCTLKRTEQSLIKERNLLRTLIDTAIDYVYVKDTQSRFIMVNTSAWKASGREINEANMIGKTDFDFFPHELAQQYYADEQEMFRTGIPISNKLEPNVTVNGEPTLLLTSKVPLRDEQGQIIGLVGISRDVTEYMQAQERIQASEARFNLLAQVADASNIGVVLADSEGRISQANDAFLRMAGYDRAEMEHMNWIIMTPPEYSEVSADATQAADGKVISLEKELFRKDGSRLPILVVASRLNNSIQDMVCLVIDLTQQRQLEAERLEAALDKERAVLLTEFVSNLSHDLKTPLSIIQSSLYLLQKLDDPVRQKAKIQNIQDQTLLLEKLIQSVLTMSRLDQGYELSFSALDLNQVMTELERSLRPAAERKTQTLMLELQSDLPPVRASESELYRVIVNLIENALNYTPESGTITLRTYQLDSTAVVEVQDTGMGIAPDILPHIFDRFYRAEKARFAARGTGLGLAIVKRIMELHSGKAEVESTLGIGSTFRIVLPLDTS